MDVPPRSLVMGSPGKVKRSLTDDEVASIQGYADRYVGYRLDYMSSGSSAGLPPAGGLRPAVTSMSTKPPSGTRDFLPDDVRRREHVIGVVRARVRALRLRAARDAGVREHRDAARQVRRRGQQAHFQDPEARRARGQRRGGPCAALRPDRAARARRGAVPERAAEVLQALPDSAGVARGPAGARAASASSTSAISTRSDRRRRWSRPSSCRRSARCSRRWVSATSRSS